MLNYILSLAVFIVVGQIYLWNNSPLPTTPSRAPSSVEDESCTQLFRSIQKISLKSNLSEALSDLEMKFPNHVKRVHELPIEIDEDKGPGRDILVISLRNLSVEERKSLLEGYLKLTSLNTLSFPLKEKAGHLFVHANGKVYDHLNDFREMDYRLPKGKRLEVFINLKPDEYTNLLSYIKNIKADKIGTIGHFDFKGIKGKTREKIEDNRSIDNGFGEFPNSGEGHNCVTWICKAPLGSNNELLADLISDKNDYAVGNHNTSRWPIWLLTQVKRERVPFAVYFTENEPLDEAVMAIEKGLINNWSFFPDN